MYPPPGYAPPGYGQPFPGGGYGGPSASSYAGWWRRVGGWLIDWVLLAVVEAIIAAPFHVLSTTHEIVNGRSVEHFHIHPIAELVSFLIALAYGTILVGAKRGQTIGMMATGVRAVLAADGGTVGHARAAGRSAFEQVLPILLFIPWIVDMLFPLWDGRNQTLHDKVSGTVVVRTR
jgi:uncharacterized RDD family membrane protein YckC